MEAQGIKISTEFIRLEALLKFTGLVPTGGEAKAVIQEGLVRVDGQVCTQRGKKLYPGSTVDYDGFLLRSGVDFFNDGVFRKNGDPHGGEEKTRRENEREQSGCLSDHFPCTSLVKHRI